MTRGSFWISASKASSRIPPCPATLLREPVAIGGRGVEEVASTALAFFVDKAQRKPEIHWEEKMHGENLGTELTLVDMFMIYYDLLGKPG